jgi:hypothetical protein
VEAKVEVLEQVVAWEVELVEAVALVVVGVEEVGWEVVPVVDLVVVWEEA